MLIGCRNEDNNSSAISYSLESTKNFQTESTWPCSTADAKTLVVKVTHSVPGPFKRNDNMHHIYFYLSRIYLCKCILRIFIAQS